MGSSVLGFDRGAGCQGGPYAGRDLGSCEQEGDCKSIGCVVPENLKKGKGGSWEKAEALELVNTQKTLASSSMLALTNA